MDYNQVKTAGFEDYIYYIMLAVVWIFGLIKKNQKKTPKTPSNPYKPTSSAPTEDSSQDSVPDLLKDLFEDMREEELPDPYQRKPTVETQTSRASTPSINRDAQATETVWPSTNQKYEKYTGHQPIDIEETPSFSRRAENYRIKKTKVNKYKKMLSTTSGMKQAVIASEILKRKF